MPFTLLIIWEVVIFLFWQLQGISRVFIKNSSSRRKVQHYRRKFWKRHLPENYICIRSKGEFSDLRCLMSTLNRDVRFVFVSFASGWYNKLLISQFVQIRLNHSKYSSILPNGSQLGFFGLLAFHGTKFHLQAVILNSH